MIVRGNIPQVHTQNTAYEALQTHPQAGCKHDPERHTAYRQTSRLFNQIIS